MNSDNQAVAQKASLMNGAVCVMAAAKKRSWPVSSQPFLLWGSLALVTAVGCLGFFRDLALLWGMWTGDPLRSIGILLPPVSILLTLRVWKQNGWERRGSWWGLALIGLAFAISGVRQGMMVMGNIGRMELTLLPVSSPLYFYWAGIVVLFAGWRVWCRAWFPLLLMLLAQPIPGWTPGLFDLPLQKASAHIARSFATLIGFAPRTPELRLMFSPDFGMFIAPGCDGMRGAVTMGYFALILGYLKRVSVPRWILYVSGAVLLGYLFNFARLCMLVIYYRIALGHGWLEQGAKQADYAIGFCLFAVAMLLFLWAALRKKDEHAAVESDVIAVRKSLGTGSLAWKGAALAGVAAMVIALQAQEIRSNLLSGGRPAPSPNWMPKQIGDFHLDRTWYEQSAGIPIMEDAAYSAPDGGEVMMGVWVGALSSLHNAQDCWLARGLETQQRTVATLASTRGQAVPFDIDFYSDGITDSIVATALCSPSYCSAYPNSPGGHVFGLHFTRTEVKEGFFSRQHPVSFVVRIEVPHTDAPQATVYQNLNAELRRFAAGLDLPQLSRTFQQG